MEYEQAKLMQHSLIREHGIESRVTGPAPNIYFVSLSIEGVGHLEIETDLSPSELSTVAGWAKQIVIWR